MREGPGGVRKYGEGIGTHAEGAGGKTVVGILRTDAGI